MRISDWSSDVCASDLFGNPLDGLQLDFHGGGGAADDRRGDLRRVAHDAGVQGGGIRHSGAGEAEGHGQNQGARGSAKQLLHLRCSCDLLFMSRRSEEHTSELQSLMRISYAVFCLKKKKTTKNTAPDSHQVQIR